MYPQVIEEWKLHAQLSSDHYDSDLAAAADQGFRSRGWKGALTRGIEVRQVQHKVSHCPAFVIAKMFAELGDKESAFQWLNTVIRNVIASCRGLKLNLNSIPCILIRALPNWR